MNSVSLVKGVVPLEALQATAFIGHSTGVYGIKDKIYHSVN